MATDDLTQLSDEELIALAKGGSIPSMSATKEPDWGIADPIRRALGSVFDDPILHTTNISMEPNVNGPMTQTPGIRKLAGDALDLGMSTALGAGGVVGGEMMGGPVGGYMGGALGAETGSMQANELAKKLGLRPDIPETSLQEQFRRLPDKLLMDLALPVVAKGAAKVARGPIDLASDMASINSKRALNFLDQDTQVLRALTDDPRKIEKLGIDKTVEKIPEIFEGVPVSNSLGAKGQKSSFSKILENLNSDRAPDGTVRRVGLIDKTGQEIDAIAEEAQKRLSKLSPEDRQIVEAINAPTDVPALSTTAVGEAGAQEVGPLTAAGGGTSAKAKKFGVKLGDIIDVEKLRSGEAEALGVEARSANSVVDLELENIAKKHLPEGDVVRYRQAIKRTEELKNLAGRYENAGKQIATEDAEKLTEEYHTNLDYIHEFEGKLMDVEFTIPELRRWKTRFYDNARFDRARIPDNIQAQRAETYKEIGHAFQDAFVGAVAKADPGGELAARLTDLNGKYKALMDVRPLIEYRDAQSRLGGKYFTTGAFQQQESAGPVRRLMNAANPFPETATPEMRLSVGLGRSSRSGLRMLANVGDVLSTGFERGVRNPIDALSSATPGNSPLFKYSPIGVADASALYGMGTEAINQFSPSPAQAQDLIMPGGSRSASNGTEPILNSLVLNQLAHMGVITDQEAQTGVDAQSLPPEALMQAYQVADSMLAGVKNAQDFGTEDDVRMQVSNLVASIPYAFPRPKTGIPGEIEVDGKPMLIHPQDQLQYGQRVRDSDLSELEKTRILSELHKTGKVLRVVK